MFAREKAQFEEALGGLMAGVVAMEHIGSTAVQGLAAKPVIDIAIGLREHAFGERTIEPITGLGYEYRAESGIPGRYYFRRGDPRSHHVHMVEYGCPEWEKNIRFRDTLRARPDLAEEYAALKRDLARRYAHDRPGYTLAKAPFIERVLAIAAQAIRP